MDQVPKDWLNRYFAVRQDLKTIPGREAFFGGLYRGQLPNEDSGGLMKCSEAFPNALIQDLDGLANVLTHYPEHLGHTRVMEVADVISNEIHRILNNPNLLPASVNYAAFARTTRTKWDHINQIISETHQNYGQVMEDLARSNNQEDLAEARPTHQTGLAPWSQLLIPGAPAIREAEIHRDDPRYARMQVLTPVADSIVSQWQDQFREAEQQLGLETPGDEDEDEDEIKEENLNVPTDDIYAALETRLRTEGNNRAMTLAEVNDMFSRLNAMAFPLDNATAIRRTSHMLQHEQTVQNQVRMTCLRRRRDDDEAAAARERQFQSGN